MPIDLLTFVHAEPFPIPQLQNSHGAESPMPEQPAAQNDHHTTSTNSGVLASARERNQSPTEAEKQNSVTWKLGAE